MFQLIKQQFSTVVPHVWHEGKNQESDNMKNLIPMNKHKK